MTRLEAIKAREQAATDGPWVGMPASDHGGWGWGIDSPLVETEGQASINAEFAGHARDDVPWMRERLEEMKKACKRAVLTCSPFARTMIEDALAKLEE